jgi:deoxycytidylate deaminase
MKHERFLEMAQICAEQSTMHYRHGCIAVLHGKVMAKGYNSQRNYSKDKVISNCCSCHAEVDAIRNAIKQNVGHREHI